MPICKNCQYEYKSGFTGNNNRFVKSCHKCKRLNNDIFIILEEILKK